jgi:RNA polymerase sigma factor (sigma-70 family)
VRDSDRSAFLVQDAWLRRVARALVNDQHLAEDLAQDAWVASVEHRRFGPDARHWLRGLLRNRTSAHFRQRAARDQRERQSSRGDVAPAPDEVLAELQLRERVAHELGALEEPYRTAVYLRFVAGHSLRETARRMGVAPATATERVQAGLVRLRRRLDGAHGGERRAWFLPLLPWARPSASLLTSTSISIAMLTVLTLAATLLGPFTPFHTQPTSSEIVPELEVSAVDPDLEPNSLVSIITLPARAAASSFEREMHSSTTGLTGASLTGTFLRPDGAPAEGATWVLRGHPANDQLVQDYGVPENWVDPSGVLDAAGRFDVTFAAHRAFQYGLTVTHAELVPVTWRWVSIGENEHQDLGEVTLRAAGRIIGTVVDPTGARLDARTWFVYASEAGSVHGLGLQRAGTGPVETTPSASFEVGGLPAGPVTLSLYDRELGWLPGPTVTVVAGQSVEADIVVTALGVYADSIVARFRMQPSARFPGPSAEHVWLVPANGERRPARRDTVGFVFDDVGPGQHRVEVDDPRLAAWSQDRLSAGAFVQGDLCGSAALEFRVTLPSGEPVPAFSVDARSVGVLYSSSRFLAATEAEPLPGGVLAGLVPGDYVFTLEAAGVSATAKVTGLAAGETRVVPVILDAARLVRGRVVHSNGEPAAGQLVRLVTPALIDDSPESPLLDGDAMMVGDTSSARHQVSRTVTDANGWFTLAPGAGTEHIVVVGRYAEPQVESARLDTSAGAHVGELALVLERGARLIVHIEPPAGLSTAEWKVDFVRSGLVPPGVFATQYAYADNSGRFVLGPIVEGHGQLVLVTEPGPMTPGAVPAHGVVLAELTLVAGETRTESYPYPGPAPVAVTVDMSSGVVAGHPITVVLVPTTGAKASVASGPPSSIGPLVVVPGTYVAWLCGHDWRARVADITIAASSTTLAIDPLLSARRVRIVDAAGAPLRDRALLLVGQPSQLHAPGLTTDTEGWIDLRLGAGSYTIGLDLLDPTLPFPRASLDWPLASGVEVVTVQ